MDHLKKVGPAKTSEKKEFLVVEVLIENIGASKVAYDPKSFRIRTDNLEDGVTDLMGDDDKALTHADELKKGEHVRGTVDFTIDSDSTGLKLIYPSSPEIWITLDK